MNSIKKRVIEWTLLFLSLSLWTIASGLPQYPKRSVLVVFYRKSCLYCQQFLPVVQRFERTSHIKVVRVTTERPSQFENLADEYATDAIVTKFFPEGKVIVPSVFLINGKKIYPISKGYLTFDEFTHRFQSVIHWIKKGDGMINAHWLGSSGLN